MATPWLLPLMKYFHHLEDRNYFFTISTFWNWKKKALRWNPWRHRALSLSLSLMLIISLERERNYRKIVELKVYCLLLDIFTICSVNITPYHRRYHLQVWREKHQRKVNKVSSCYLANKWSYWNSHCTATPTEMDVMSSLSCQLHTALRHLRRVSRRDCLDQVGLWVRLSGTVWLHQLKWEDPAPSGKHQSRVWVIDYARVAKA